MKWFPIIPGILVCIVLIIVIIGYLLPVKHTSSVQVSINASPPEVWTRLTDFKGYPAKAGTCPLAAVGNSGLKTMAIRRWSR